MRKKILQVVVSSILFFNPQAYAKDVLTLEEFKNQIAKTHSEFAASKTRMITSKGKHIEFKMNYVPSLFASSSFNYKDAGSTVSMQPANTKAFNNTFGVNQTFDFGLQFKASISNSRVDLSDFPKFPLPTNLAPLSPIFSPKDKVYYQNQLNIETSIPLLKNYLGSSLKLTEKLIEQEEKMKNLNESFLQENLLLQGEMVYLRLSLLRKMAKAQLSIIERQKEIRSWIKKRLDVNLADKADYLQSNVGVKAREIELEAITNEVKKAERDFNTQRGFDEQDLAQELEDFSGLIEHGIEEPKRLGEKKDTQSIRLLIEMAALSVSLASEKYKPDLNAFVNLGTDSQEDSIGGSFSKSFSAKHPNFTVGLRFSMPLASEVIREITNNALLEKTAAEQHYQRKLFEEERAWKDLQQSYLDAKKNLANAKVLESLQREREKEEQARHKIGRSTLMQALSSEQDLAQAVLGKIKAESQILQVYAQMKTFNQKS